jgi:hypothetical protein
MSNDKPKKYEKEWSFNFETLGKAVRDRLKPLNEEDIHRETFVVPLEDTQHANFHIGFSTAETIIDALDEESPNLFEATIEYVGEIEFDVATTNTGHTTVTLKQNKSFDKLLNIGNKRLEWHIFIHPRILSKMHLSGGVGKTDINLLLLDVVSIDYKGGVGETIMTLPQRQDQTALKASTGVGKLEINIPEYTNADLQVSGGVGQTTINLAKSSGVMTTAKIGVGDITLPKGYVALKEKRQFMSKNGTWISPNYDDAVYRVMVRFEGGVGELSIMQQ